MTGHELKAFRVERDFSQEHLASVLGIARSTLIGYERGHSPIPKMLALAVAALHADASAYQAPAQLIQLIEGKKFKRVPARIVSSVSPKNVVL